MAEVAPASVLLPTVRWTDACRELCDQLAPRDELLIICDSETDPVTAHRSALPDGGRIVVAGEPDGCSGKANAIAAGMEAASHDRIVWTDDDFHHPPDWLSTLKADYERQGPTTEVPVFVGRDPLSVLLEPSYATSTLLASAGELAWGGALIFDRRDVDEDALLYDLRRTVSDDGTIADYLDFEGTDRTRRVEIGGTIRETLERHARFMQISRRHGRAPWAVLAGVVSLIGVLFLLFPVVGLVVSTVGYAALYAAAGIRRWTFLLGWPALVTGPVLLAYALARRTFVWGGRRYRWHSMFDVEVVEAAGDVSKSF